MSKQNIFNPHAIKVVGIDTTRPEGHPLYNPSSPFPSERLIRSVMQYGVMSNIGVVEDDGELIVTDGRARVLAMRAANKRLEAEGANYRWVITTR